VFILPIVFSAGEAIINPLVNLWLRFVDVIPGIILAIIILIIGYIIAFVLGHAVKIILQRAGLDRQVSKAKLTKSVGHVNVSSLLGEVVKWLIFLVFLGSAADQLRLGVLSDVILRFVSWIPGVIFGVLVVLFGLWLAHYIGSKIEEYGRVKGSRFASGIVKGVITFIAIVIGLEQIGVEVGILRVGFLIVLAGISLAIGLSFGLGGKKDASDYIKKIKKYF
tara:strand:- start:10864 stop:11529 length:666 start_codon:yes stop_codon:yes gene_type:complete